MRVKGGGEEGLLWLKYLLRETRAGGFNLGPRHKSIYTFAPLIYDLILTVFYMQMHRGR